MAYGIVKVDNITFDNGGSDQNVTVSGLYRATTSGVTVSGTIAAGTVSGVTVIGSTTVSGATVTGTTANFTSGNFSNLISAAATMSGALIMANQQQVRFREAVGNGVNHIALQAPAIVSADQTITLPDETGTVVTTGDNGSVTSTMILDGTILNADINASAAIADTKLATISTAGKVSGTAITSGNIDTSGELQITNSSPTIRLAESDGTATHSQTVLARAGDQFAIQTRNSTGVYISTDYLISADASGATDHIWRIANTEKARLNSAGLTVVNDLTISDKIIHAGDTDTAIRFPAANTVTVETAGFERARITSAGLVGIGTSAPDALLHTVATSAGASTYGGFIQNFDSTIGTEVRFAFASNANSLSDNRHSWIGGVNTGGFNGTALTFATNPGGNVGVERVRIDSSGRLLVGTTTRRANFNNTTDAPFLQLEATSFVGASLSVVRNVNSDSAGGIILGKTRGGSLGSNTIVNSGDNLGIISWQGADGTDMIPAAQISCSVDGTPGANDMPGRLVFSTTADGASSPTERMRITSTGAVFIGSTTSPNTANLNLICSSSIASISSDVSGGSNSLRTHFVFSNGNGVVGSITTNGSATAYVTSSDYRLKENITLLDGAIARLNQLPVHRFNFIADPDTVVDGFIAHEAAAVVPECVTGEKDEEDENGDPVYQGIDQSKVVPLLTAALQEAIAMINALEARIAALEA
jgi:hypothetical protein